MLVPVHLSLRGLLGDAYTDAVIDAEAFFRPDDRAELVARANEKVDCYPAPLAARMDALLEQVGRPVSRALSGGADGAATQAFAAATRRAACPLAGLGPYRVGEDGRLYFAAKSEHYHAPLGHRFPGYRLLEHARFLGISNTSHNNQRGHVTRLLEEELVRLANGVDRAGLADVLASEAPGVPNRVLNLETGSLAVEAGLKMMLARFYRLEAGNPTPRYAGRTPVFLVMADRRGGRAANYHGTTVTAQTLRGLWPELYDRAADAGAYRVEAVAINDLRDFEDKLARFDRPPYKVAGFLHEIVLMNYSALVLTREYLAAAYARCRAADVPVLVDEIQSCLWYEGLFLFRHYGLAPDFVAIGKGFPGGEYPASKLLLAAPFDNLNLFGALVTNGQEELASLAYLITMAYAQRNVRHVAAIGQRYGERLDALAAEFPDRVSAREGTGLLAGLNFHRVEDAARFAATLSAEGLDVSAQTYKADCPPAALTKPPLICSEAMIDFLADRMRAALRALD